MAKEKKAVIFTSDIGDKELKVCTDKLINEFVSKYNFISGYNPVGQNVLFLLLQEDNQDTKNDKWKILFFNKEKKLTTAISGPITLDNIGAVSFDGDNENLVLVKEIDGNYEEVMNISIDMKKKQLQKQEVTVK